MSVRMLLALAGWPEVAVPAAAWSGVDRGQQPLTLAHLAPGPRPQAVPVATNEDRSVRAVLAGALHNRRELRAQLGGRHAFSGRDDAEIVIHLYEERGPQCVKALRGPFALALWDVPAGRLLLARDHLGLVPLYYAVDRRRLAAASWLPALAALPGLAATWDAAALDAFLCLGSVPPPATFYAGIRQLRPGELALWEDGRLRTQRYWELTFPERRMGRRDLAAVVREQVLEALRLRQGGVLAGLLLSAGFDAAALLALGGTDHRPPARAYTAAPPGVDEDSRMAAWLAARAQVEHVLVADALDWPAAVEMLLAAHGAPSGGPEAAVLQMAAARAAADHEVALAGIGGEEVFGGSPAARAADRLQRFRRLPALVREVAEVWARLAPGRRAPELRALVTTERRAPLEMYARATSLFLPEEREALYTEEALAALGETGPWAVLAGLFAEAAAAGAVDTGDAFHYVEIALRLPGRAGAAIPAAALGLDLRLPLADFRLAQLAASVPAAARGNAHERQLLLQAAVSDLLPRTVLERPHASPVPVARAWESGSLRALLEDTLAPARVAAQGLFRPETVSRLCREQLTGARDHGPRLWALIQATRWLERQAVSASPALRVAG
jgi:asparagine synthase (glutamine-hydrolysing)